MFNKIKAEAAQALTEYSLIYLVVVLVVIFLLVFFGDQVGDMYQWIIDHLPF